MIGWARYEGVGPDVASESAILDEEDSSSLGNNAPAGADLGDGGVAGSSVPKLDWLADVDATSAIFGVLAALGHVLGFAFYVLALSAAVRLFRTQFRSNRMLFRPAARASVALFTWLVVFTVAGFYLAIQKGFAKTVIAVLNKEGFLCQVYIPCSISVGRAGRVFFIFVLDFFLRSSSFDVAVVVLCCCCRCCCCCCCCCFLTRRRLNIVFVPDSMCRTEEMTGFETRRARICTACFVRCLLLLIGVFLRDFCNPDRMRSFSNKKVFGCFTKPTMLYLV